LRVGYNHPDSERRHLRVSRTVPETIRHGRRGRPGLAQKSSNAIDSAQSTASTSLDPQLLQMQELITRRLVEGVTDLKHEEVPGKYRGVNWEALDVGGSTSGMSLRVECEVMRSAVFRRITLVLIVVEDGFQACLVCVEPHEAYDLPMFGAEVVSRQGRVTVAFADCSPVNAPHDLPAAFKAKIRQLQRKHDLESMPMRKTPPEFQAVFSDTCVVKMPQGEGAQIANFLQYLDSALTEYLTLADDPPPVPSEGRAAVREAQMRYLMLGLTNAQKKVVPVLRQCTSPLEVDRFLNWVWLDKFPH